MAEPTEIVWHVEQDSSCAELMRNEFSRFVEVAASSWSQHFPIRKGYLIFRRPLEGDVPGMRLSAIRGDFHARLDLSCNWQERIGCQGKRLSIHIKASAHSNRIEAVERRAEKIKKQARLGAWCWGGGFVATGLWLLVANTSAILGGVAVGILAATAIIGTSFGEHIASLGRTRALAALSGDSSVQTDFRRWRSLSRYLFGYRKVLMRARSAMPFRRAIP